METLIETLTSKEINRWASPPSKVLIPGTNDVVFPGGDTRPMNIGPNHFLATATVSEPALHLNQKRGPETVDVVGQVVTINRPAVDMTGKEIADRNRANDLGDLVQGHPRETHVLVELVTVLITNSTISEADFTPATKKMYRDIKSISDRLKL